MEIRWVPAPARRVGRAAVALGARRRARAPTPTRAAARASVATCSSAQNDDGGWGGAPRPAVDPAVHRLDGARARGRRPQPARRRRRPSASTTCAPTPRELSDLGEIVSARSSSCAPPGREPRVGGRDLDRRAARAAARERLVRGPREHDGVRGARAARGRPPHPGPARSARAPRGSPARRTPTAASTSPAAAAPPASTTPARRCRRSAAAGRGAARPPSGAARFLVRHQNADGGFPLVPGGPSNAQSTAWAVQGLLAAGRDPARSAATARATR